MSFTLIHTADLHLGKSFSTLPPERAGQRRADLVSTLGRLCRRARELQVDLLCITGDLFDRAAPSLLLQAVVRRELAEAGVPVLLIPGNHDPLETGSPYLESGWPENVWVAAISGWQRAPITEREVWAFGYVKGRAHDNPWRSFPGCADDALLALHAACLSPGLAVEANFYPFSPADIPPCAYLALGHHHRALAVGHTAMAWYAGAPEPLEAEISPAVALLVTLDGSAAHVEPFSVATRRHRKVVLDVTGRNAGEIWDRALAETAQDDLLTLSLTGMQELSASLDLAALRTELSARCFAAEVITDRLLLPSETASDGVLGALTGITHARMDALAPGDPQRLLLERAMRYAAMALEGTL